MFCVDFSEETRCLASFIFLGCSSSETDHISLSLTQV